MKSNDTLQNSLRATRTRLGLSQSQLAEAAGVARQTIGGIEGGLYAPSASVALRLAKTLGCAVEELFWLDDDRPAVEVHYTGAESIEDGQRVSLTRVRGRWIARRLSGEDAFRTEMVPADGIAVRGGQNQTSVSLIGDRDALAQTVSIAGCAPVLSLWARSVERWLPGLRVQWVHANSTEALKMLARGEVHAAGLHFHGIGSDFDNAAAVRKTLPGERLSLVSLGVWQEGLLITAGNPKKIISAADLARKDVRLVNREQGASSRALLEAALQKIGASLESVRTLDAIARSHEEAARIVASGGADVGVGTESMAALFGLHFIPLQAVQYDIAIAEQDMNEGPVRDLLATLSHRWVRSQFQLLGGYDTSGTGSISTVA